MATLELQFRHIGAHFFGSVGRMGFDVGDGGTSGSVVLSYPARDEAEI